MREGGGERIGWEGELEGAGGGRAVTIIYLFLSVVNKSNGSHRTVATDQIWNVNKTFPSLPTQPAYISLDIRHVDTILDTECGLDILLLTHYSTALTLLPTAAAQLVAAS